MRYDVTSDELALSPALELQTFEQKNLPLMQYLSLLWPKLVKSCYNFYHTSVKSFAPACPPARSLARSTFLFLRLPIMACRLESNTTIASPHFTTGRGHFATTIINSIQLWSLIITNSLKWSSRRSIILKKENIYIQLSPFFFFFFFFFFPKSVEQHVRIFFKLDFH
jgi:hypothetical protein